MSTSWTRSLYGTVGTCRRRRRATVSRCGPPASRRTRIRTDQPGRTTEKRPRHEHRMEAVMTKVRLTLLATALAIGAGSPTAAQTPGEETPAQRDARMA